MEKYDHGFKIVLIGETKVGKSCIRNNAEGGYFKKDVQLTVGVDFGTIFSNIN